MAVIKVEKDSNGGRSYGSTYEKKKWGNEKKYRKRYLEMFLALKSFMESGTCCTINAVVGIKPTPQDFMVSINPINQSYHRNDSIFSPYFSCLM